MGKLLDSCYATLDAQYGKEQVELTEEIYSLKISLTIYEKNKKSAENFISFIDKYQSFDNLTITMLNEFINKSLIHERDHKCST